MKDHQHEPPVAEDLFEPVAEDNEADESLDLFEHVSIADRSFDVPPASSAWPQIPDSPNAISPPPLYRLSPLTVERGMNAKAGRALAIVASLCVVLAATWWLLRPGQRRTEAPTTASAPSTLPATVLPVVPAIGLPPAASPATPVEPTTPSPAPFEQPAVPETPDVTAGSRAGSAVRRAAASTPQSAQRTRSPRVWPPTAPVPPLSQRTATNDPPPSGRGTRGTSGAGLPMAPTAGAETTAAVSQGREPLPTVMTPVPTVAPPPPGNAPAARTSEPAAAPAATHSVAAAAPTAVNDDMAVRAVINRYRAAFVSLDVDQARAVWPTVDARALKRAFDQLAMQEIDFAACSIAIDNERASAGCSGNLRYVPKVGSKNPRVEARVWNFELRRAPDQQWRIDAVDTR